MSLIIVAAMTFQCSVFTDLDGFTSSIKENTERTIERVFAIRDAIKFSADQTHGRVVSYIGDSALIVFDTAQDAKQFICTSRKNSPEPINFGLACGDVYVLDKDVFGYSVNVASRLGEDQAHGGQILTEAGGDETNTLCTNSL